MNLQALRTALPENHPITGICIVADPTKNPYGYEVLYRSSDKNDDCDLWKDGLFRTKVTRYLCITRETSVNNVDVLDDLVINNEKDPAPPGFTVIMETVDTHDKASRKKQVCVKMSPRNMKNDAICNVVILSRAKRPPPSYTLVGEINGLLICFKRDKIPVDSPPPINATTPPPNNQTTNGPTQQALPYQLSYNAAPQPNQTSNQNKYNTLIKQTSVLMPNKPLADVPFQLATTYEELKNLNNFQVPEVHYRSLVDIENEYGYDFRIERTAAARLPPDV